MEDMVDDVVSDDRERYRPIIQGKTFPLLVEEVMKILKTLEPEKCVPELPLNMRGGDVYVFKPRSPDLADNWRSDGIRWRNAGSIHLPRNKKSLIHKRYFNMVSGDGKGTTNDVKKDVYCWDIGVEESDLVLVHYMGNLGGTDETTEEPPETGELASHSSSTDEMQSVADGSNDHVADGSSDHVADGSSDHVAIGNITHVADGNIKHEADGNIKHEADGKIKHEADGNVNDEADGNINHEADGNINHEAEDITRIQTEPLITSTDEPINMQPDTTTNNTTATTTVAMDISVQPDTTTVEPMEDLNPKPSTSSASRSEPSTVDLDVAMKTVKAALEAKSGSKPMMDVFNKLMESMVSTDQNPELEYCLVVADRKSGQSSLHGTDEAKKLMVNQRNLRRKKTETAEDENEDDAMGNSDDEDYDEEPPAKKQKVMPKANFEDNEVLMSNGEVIKLPKPKKELSFNYSIISDEEKRIHADFFGSRKSTKTPERYLKIRNYILDAWARQKPAYLNKLQARKGLTGCGDVTPISRIHSYLECKGVINFNADKSVGTPRGTPMSRKAEESDDEEEAMEDDEDGDIVAEDSDKDFIPEVEQTRSTRRKNATTPKSNTSSKNSKTIKEKSDNLKNTAQGEDVTKKISKNIIKEKSNNIKDTPKGNKVKQTVSSNTKTPTRQSWSGVEVSLRSSGRRTRNVATPNWADILSGRKNFREEGAVIQSPKHEIKESKEENSSPKRGRPSKTIPVAIDKTDKETRNKKDKTIEKESKEKQSSPEKGRSPRLVPTEIDKADEETGNKKGKVIEKYFKSHISSPKKGRPLKPVLDDSNKSEKESEEYGKASDEDLNDKTVSRRRRPIKHVSGVANLKCEVEEITKSTMEGSKDVNKSNEKHNKDEEAEKVDKDVEHDDQNTEEDNDLDDDSERVENKLVVKLETKRDTKVKNKTEPDATPRKSKTTKKVDKEPEIEEVEWTGSGNLYKVRQKGNRHMPYELKVIENSPKTADETSTKESVSDSSMSSSLRRGSRSRNSYKHVCKVCKRTFSLEYLLEEHLKSHGVKSKDEEEDDESNVRGTGKDEDIEDDIEENISELDDDMDEDFAVKGNKSDDDEDENYEDDGQEDIKTVKKEKKPNTQKVKIAEGGKKPICKVCGTVFLSVANLKRHSLLHTNYMYECPYCAKIMKRKDYVLAHVRKCHKEVDLELNPIDFKNYTHKVGDNENQVGGNENSQEETEAEKGINEAKKEKVENITEDGDADEYEIKPGIAGKLRTGLGKSVCPDCTKIFDAREDLEQHMILVHEKELKDSAYTCQACKKQFKNLVSYQVHKLTHRKREHDCPHCGEKFPTNSQLQVHKRHDHNIQYGTLMYFGFLMVKGRITCEVCSLDFDSMADYHDHRADHLTLEYFCRECGNGFTAEDDLQKHTDSNCTVQNLHLPCGVCDLKFAMYDTRRKHILTYHPKTTDFFCHHCGACFEDMDKLRTHFPIHKAEKIFECEYCEKHFFEKRNLIDHRHLHRSTKNFQCNICDKFYISSKSLQRHVKLHMAKDKKPCKYCDNKFQYKEDLERHMEQAHGDVEEDQKENYEHKCTVCSRTFLLKSRLVKHMQLHNNDVQDGGKYQCKFCNEHLDTVVMPLWRHMKQEHPEELKKEKSKKELICEICGFTTLHKQRLQRHMETHNSEKLFECQVCNKKFQTTSSMLTHMIIHRGKIKQGVSPHTICRWQGCHKKFLKRSNMKRHLLSHIFKVKVAKDPCDCKNCPAIKYGSEDVQATQFTYFEDTSNGEVVEDDENITVAQRKSGSINVVLTSGGAIQGYESMDVLQEAIAQIEDIEKNTGTEEYTEMSETAGVVIVGKDGDISETEIARENTCETDPEGAVIRIEEEVEGNETSVVQVVENTTNQHEGVSQPLGTVEVDEAANTAEAGTQSIEAMAPSGNLEEGMEVEFEGYECSVCELVFKTKCQVLYHSEKDHVDNQFPICDICGKHYIDQKALREHLTIHSGTKDYKCKTCGKTFRTKQCIRQHSFIHAEVKPFICSYCGHGFTQRGFFEEHVRRHTGIKPYQCRICSKAFVSKGLLKSHMYSHTGNRPHKCDYCNKSFTEHYQLIAHERTHNDDRPFQCTECDKAFFVKPKLIRHMHTVHNIQKEMLSNFVATRINDGVGYRDRTKLKNYSADAAPRKTQVVYIDAQGNIISQVMRTEEEIRAEKEQMRLQKMQASQTQQRAERSPPFIVIKPSTKQENVESDVQEMAFEVITNRNARGDVEVNTVLVSQDSPLAIGENEEEIDNSNDMETFEVVTTRDASGQIQVNTIGSEHVIVENSEPKTIVSLAESEDNVLYQSMQPIENDGSIELDGQNYTFVTHTDDQDQEGHLELITQALAGVQAQGDTDQGQIQIITSDHIQEDAEGNIEIYTQSEMEVGSQEGPENFSINIGEDGTVNAADFEKIEALRNLYSDQPIVIVLESQQQEED